MRYSAQHKELTRKKILDAAARRFRAEGYEGLGVDGLAKAAGVTNGAFYGHFATKADAFREIAVQGLVDLRLGVEKFQAECGADWLVEFARFYFSPPKVERAEDVCALPCFAPDIARAPESTRAAFETALADVVASLVRGLSGEDAGARLARAWVILAIMAGGVALLRMTDDAAQRAALAAVYQAAVAAQR